MKDRAILFTSLTLVIATALFLWLTWPRSGMIDVSPALRWLVFGAASFALAVVGLFLYSRYRIARARRRQPSSPAPAFRAPSVEPSAEELDQPKVTTVAMK